MKLIKWATALVMAFALIGCGERTHTVDTSKVPDDDGHIQGDGGTIIGDLKPDEKDDE